MKIYVKAVNELGETTSAPLVLEPVSSGKENILGFSFLLAFFKLCLYYKYYIS